MGAIGDISSMQDVIRIIQVSEAVLVETDNELVNDYLEENRIEGEYYA